MLFGTEHETRACTLIRYGSNNTSLVGDFPVGTKKTAKVKRSFFIHLYFDNGNKTVECTAARDMLRQSSDTNTSRVIVIRVTLSHRSHFVTFP